MIDATIFADRKVDGANQFVRGYPIAPHVEQHSRAGQIMRFRPMAVGLQSHFELRDWSSYLFQNRNHVSGRACAQRSSSSSAGLAPDCLSASIAVSIPPAFTPVNLDPPFQFNFTARSFIRFSPLLYMGVMSMATAPEGSVWEPYHRLLKS